MRRLLLVLFLCLPSFGASVQTTNFIITADDPVLVRQLASAAEWYRSTLAIRWLGHELPPWTEKCPIIAKIDKHNGGNTSFIFGKDEVYGWRMTLQGNRVRLVDSVLPHEVMHTVFATHFLQPLPRWADEGASVLSEHHSQIVLCQYDLDSFVLDGKMLDFRDMVVMMEYPKETLPLYAEGQSVCDWLVTKFGRHKYVSFLEDGLQDQDWPRAIQAAYGFQTPHAMQEAWTDWFIASASHPTYSQTAP